MIYGCKEIKYKEISIIGIDVWELYVDRLLIIEKICYSMRELDDLQTNNLLYAQSFKSDYLFHDSIDINHFEILVLMYLQKKIKF